VVAVLFTEDGVAGVAASDLSSEEGFDGGVGGADNFVDGLAFDDEFAEASAVVEGHFAGLCDDVVEKLLHGVGAHVGRVLFGAVDQLVEQFGQADLVLGDFFLSLEEDEDGNDEQEWQEPHEFEGPERLLSDAFVYFQDLLLHFGQRVGVDLCQQFRHKRHE